MSIRPPYAEAIFNGTKAYEFRTRKPSFDGPTRVIVYVPGSRGRVVGEVIIDGVIAGTPEEVWRRTKGKAGIDRDTFFQYFAGRAVSFALRIKKALTWSEPLDLDGIREFLGPTFRPPQYFCWLDAGNGRRLGARSAGSGGTARGRRHGPVGRVVESIGPPSL